MIAITTSSCYKTGINYCTSWSSWLFSRVQLIGGLKKRSVTTLETDSYTRKLRI